MHVDVLLRKMARLRRCITVLSFGEYNSKKKYHCIFFYCFVWEVISKTRASSLIRGSEHLETIKARGRRPSAFIYFSVFGTPDETLVLVFDILHEFTQGWLNLNNDWDIPNVCTSPYSISHERQGGGTRTEDKCFLFSEISDGLVSCDSRSVDVFDQATKQPIGTTVDHWGNRFHQCFESKPINHEGGLLVPLRFFSSF